MTQTLLSLTNRTPKLGWYIELYIGSAGFFVIFTELLVDAYFGSWLTPLWQLLAGIGCIQDVANASEREILQKTDLSVEKACAIVNFFNSDVSDRAPTCD